MATIAYQIRPLGIFSQRAVVRYAWAVVGYNVLVVLWGALVRATGSGAGCGNHWPLCNGQVIPIAPRIDTIIEFTHRVMVGGASFAVLGLLLVTFLATHQGAAARSAAAASTVLLINEAFLGALLVKLGYVTGNQSLGRVVVLSIHLSNTLLLLASLTLTAIFLATGQRRRTLFPARDASIVIPGLIVTIFVGVSGSLAALGDTLFPATNLTSAMAQDFGASSSWLLRTRWVHPASALLAAVFILWLCRRTWTQQKLAVRWIVALLVFQFAAGVIDVVLLAPVWMQIVHLFGADLYWIALIVLATSWMWPLTQGHAAAKSFSPNV